VTHALQPHLILCVALIFMHLAALHIEQSAVSCWQQCFQSHLVA